MRTSNFRHTQVHSSRAARDASLFWGSLYSPPAPMLQLESPCEPILDEQSQPISHPMFFQKQKGFCDMFFLITCFLAGCTYIK